MRIVVFFITLFSSFTCFGQNQLIDSIQSRLNTVQEDSIRVDLLLELGFQFADIDAQKTIAYSTEGRDIAHKIGYARGEGQATRNIGLGYYKVGNYDTALIYCEQAKLIAESAGLDRVKADALNTIGNIHYRKGNISKALDAYQQTLPIYEKTNRQINLAGSISNIGGILSSQGNYPRALDNFQKALKLFEELEHVVGIANVQHNIANIHEKQGDLDKALLHYRLTAKNDSISGNRGGRASTLTNIASVYKQLGDTSRAIVSYHQSIDLFDQAGANCSKAQPQTSLGSLYLQTGDIDSAYFYISTAYEMAKKCESKSSLVQSLTDLGSYYKKVGEVLKARETFKEAFGIAQEIDMRPVIAETADELYEVNKQLANYKVALEYLELKEKINREIYNEDNTRDLALLEAEYEFEKEKTELKYAQEVKIHNYNDEIARKNIIQIVIIVVLILVSLLALIISRFYILKRKSNKKLEIINNDMLEQNAEIQAQNEEITQQRDQLEERGKVVEEQKIELQTKNEELVALDEEKNALIGIVAHDLKSPLNQIRGMVSVAAMSKEGMTPEMKEYLKVIEDSSNRSVEMIDRILDINAIEGKKVELNMETIELADLLEDTYQNLSLSAHSKDITIHRNYEGKSTFVYVDRNLLLEVFENLVSNAIKFSEHGKNIFLDVTHTNKYVNVAVKDQGPGISEDDQKKLFNKYQRLSAKPTGGEKSSGLGLAIVRRYVKEMGGRVWCESQHGKGAQFIVQLERFERE